MDARHDQVGVERFDDQRFAVVDRVEESELNENQHDGKRDTTQRCHQPSLLINQIQPCQRHAIHRGTFSLTRYDGKGSHAPPCRPPADNQ